MIDLLSDLNELQKEAIAISMAAGTGKPTVIVKRVAYIISQGAQPHNILVLKFLLIRL